MTAPEWSNSSFSIQHTTKASKESDDLSSSEYIAEILLHMKECGQIDGFSNPHLSTSKISYFGGVDFKEHKFDLPSDSLEQILWLAEEDLKTGHSSVCIIENISQACIAVLGPSWNIDSAFFADHGFHEHKYLPEKHYDRYPKAQKGIEKNRQNRVYLDCRLHVWGCPNDTQKLDPTTHVFRRSCSPTGIKIIALVTRISYYRVRENFYLFLVDAPPSFVNWPGNKILKRDVQLQLWSEGDRDTMVLPLLCSEQQRYSIFKTIRFIFRRERERNILFNEWTDGIMPGPAMIYMFYSIIWSVNLTWSKLRIQNISFDELRDPKESTNDGLHSARRELAYLRDSLEGTFRFRVPEVTDLFQHVPSNRNPIQILKNTMEEAEKLQAFLMDTFQLLMSSLTVRESRLNMEQARLSAEQARRNAWLTQLASIYLPLSVVTSIFGMNLKEINGGPRVWWAILVLVMLMIITAGIYYALRILERKWDERRAAKKTAEEKAKEETV